MTHFPRRIAGAVDGYWMAAAPARRLGAARAFIGAFACAYVFVRLPHSLSYADFPASQFRPVGLIGLLLTEPLPGWAVHLLAVVAAVLSVPFMLGWRFRVTGPLFAALLWWTLSYNNSWGMIFHTENLMLVHVAVLGLATSADAWSLDARRRSISPEDHGRYRWPLLLCCWVVVIAYVLAGVAKLRNSGAGWMWGDDLRNYVAMDNVRKMLLGDSHSPVAVHLMEFTSMFRVMSVATIVVELGAPLALLGRRIAAAWVVLIVGFHASVLLLMWIVFPYQLLGFAYLPFFRVERLADRLEAIVARIRRS